MPCVCVKPVWLLRRRRRAVSQLAFEGVDRTTVNARTKCVLLAAEGKLNYSHAHAKKISATAPCTNHQMECALCQPEQNEQRP
eukprot:1749840-Prymnesium_polylepis.1